MSYTICLISCVILTLWTMLLPSSYAAVEYKDVTRLFDDKLGSTSGYNTAVRPVLNQSKVIEVNVNFDIVAIVKIDAIEQKFVVNGFMGLSWTDEMVKWNLSDYTGIYVIHPEPKQIWRPRLILTNTVEARDLFEDDYCPITVIFNGEVSWHPGSLFPTSCKLDLYKYPFDEQDCFIEMYSMGLISSEIKFKSDTGKVGTRWYSKSGEWTLVETSIFTSEPIETFDLCYFRMNFKIRRLPGFFIINIVTPIVLMSFLNILVFLIPVDSGEKISYGITVLLALTVFMSIVSDQLPRGQTFSCFSFPWTSGEKISYGITVLLALTVFMSIVSDQLPRSSDTLPLVSIYLLVLTIISVCTVMVSIAIVYFHHREEKEVKHQKATVGFKSIFKKFSVLNRATKNFSQVQVKPASQDRQFSNAKTELPDKNSSSETKSKPSETIFNVLSDLKENCSDRPEFGGGKGEGHDYVNRWRLIGKHLDCVSFIVFTVIWISVTVGFLVEIAR